MGERKEPGKTKGTLGRKTAEERRGRERGNGGGRGQQEGAERLPQKSSEETLKGKLNR
jgi:hypothetical protein